MDNNLPLARHAADEYEGWVKNVIYWKTVKQRLVLT